VAGGEEDVVEGHGGGGARLVGAAGAEEHEAAILVEEEVARPEVGGEALGFEDEPSQIWCPDLGVFLRIGPPMVLKTAGGKAPPGSIPIHSRCNKKRQKSR
jgi:hypothetical protein